MELVLQRPQRKETAKKYSVLYVDDEPVNLRIFQHAFKRDYNVYTASNGFDALDILNEHKMDLIITDQQMPRMSGVDLLAKIVPKHPNIVRMIMTGFSDIGAIIRAVNEFGLDKYLVKPWDRDQLKVEFDKALEKKEQEDTAQSQNSLNDSVLKMNESLLPRESELQSIVKDSYIVYDQSVNNNYGYWFGELDDKVVVGFFNTTENTPSAVGAKSFLSLALSELVYKSKELDSEKLLKDLFSKMDERYSDIKNIGKIDVSLAVMDKSTKELSVCGVNQNVYYFDTNDKLKMLNTGNQSYEVGKSGGELKKIVAKDMTEAYFISKNMINQIVPTNTDSDGVAFLQYIRTIRSSKMTDQAKNIKKELASDNSKCMIGIRFE